MHDKDNKGVIKYEEFLSGKKYIHKTYVASAFEKKDKKKKGVSRLLTWKSLMRVS